MNRETLGTHLDWTEKSHFDVHGVYNHIENGTGGRYFAADKVRDIIEEPP